MTDDSILLSRYAETHTEDAFAELVHRHITLVYSAALRRSGGNTHRAEDATQIVFTDLARKAKTLSRHASLTGWLHTSTRYAVSTIIRSEIRRQNREQEACNNMDESTDACWQQLRPVIDETLDRLDKRDREVILLRFFDNQTFAAIGQKLHSTEDAARKRTERALDKLRRHLTRRGVTSTAAALGLALSTHAATTVPAHLPLAITHSALAATAATSTATAGALGSLALIGQLKTGMIALTLAAALATVGSATLVIVASQQHIKLVQLRAETTTTWNPELHRLRQRLVTTERQHDELQKQLADARAKPPRRGRTLTALIQDITEAQEQDPEYVALERRRERLTIQKRYGHLFELLGLDAETREQFKELLTDEYIIRGKLIRESSKQTSDGLSDYDLVQDYQTNVLDEKVRALLGDDALALFREHRTIEERTKPYRVDTILLDLADAGHSVSPEQQTALVRMFYEEISKQEPHFKSDNLETEAGIVANGGLSPGEQSLLDRASSHFSPEQRAIIRNYFMENRSQHLLTLRARQEMADGN